MKNYEDKESPAISIWYKGNSSIWRQHFHELLSSSHVHFPFKCWGQDGASTSSKSTSVTIQEGRNGVGRDPEVKT